LLHPRPERGLVIAFGTGQTANGLRREGLENIDIVELSKTVLGLAPFFEANEGILSDPRVRAITMDGRAWLRRSEDLYDVITLEPMPPNFAGVNALYSREFYEIAASRLTRLGVMAQWLPVHMLSPEHSASITATFLEVFGDALLWYDPVGGTAILLGRRTAGLRPLGRTWPGLSREGAERPLLPTQIRRSAWLSQEALARYAQSGSIITDDNQLLQYGQLRPAATNRRALLRNSENMQILARFAGRQPFALKASRDEAAPAAP
jgi:hypothetical protein